MNETDIKRQRRRVKQAFVASMVLLWLGFVSLILADGRPPWVGIVLSVVPFSAFVGIIAFGVWLAQLDRKLAALHPPDPWILTAKPRSHVVRNLIVLGVLWWFGYTFFYAPSQEAVEVSAVELGGTVGRQQASEEVLSLMLMRFGYSADVPRLAYLASGGLDIFVATHTFEEVPYPDRVEFLGRFSKPWCEHVGSVYFPVVRVRDVKTGHELARYSCAFGKATLPQ